MLNFSYRTRSLFAVCLSLALVCLCSGHALAEDRRPGRSQLTIMTLNAEFLWDGVAPEEGRVDFPWKHSAVEAREHMRGVAEIIIRSDPDIVNLVEVENLQALTTFNDEFLAGRGYAVHLDQGTDSFTGQHRPKRSSGRASGWP